jgi:hypothetical protein
MMIIDHPVSRVTYIIVAGGSFVIVCSHGGRGPQKTK